MLPGSPPSSPVRTSLPSPSIIYEARTWNPSDAGGAMSMTHSSYDDSLYPPRPRRSPSMSSPNYWGTPNLSPTSEFGYDEPTHPRRAWTRQSRSMSYSSSSDIYGAMGGGSRDYDRVSSPESPRQPRPRQDPWDDPPPPFRDRDPAIRVHPLKRLLRWLWILLVILLCLIACIAWSLACSSLIMLSYCVAGCCENYAKGRTGGCHDCPLICDGIERSLAWSVWGCRHFIRFSRKILSTQVQWEAIRARLTPLVSPPPTLYPNPTRNPFFETFAAACDRLVEDLNVAAEGAERAMNSMVIGSLNAMADMS